MELYGDNLVSQWLKQLTWTMLLFIEHNSTRCILEGLVLDVDLCDTVIS